MSIRACSLRACVFAVDEAGGGNNGTFVNGRRIEQHALVYGDVIGFGKGRNVARDDEISDKNLEVIAVMYCDNAHF